MKMKHNLVLRAFLFFLSLMFTMILVSSSFAEKVIRYEIPGFNTSVELPDRFFVFWKDMPNDSESFVITGDTPEKWEKYFKTEPTMVFSAYTYFGTQAISMVVTKNTKMANFKELSEEDLVRFLSCWHYPSSVNNGIRNQEYYLLETDQYTFLIEKFTREEDRNSTYQIMGSTYDGENLIQMQWSASLPFTDADINEFSDELVSITIDGKYQVQKQMSDRIIPADLDHYELIAGNVSVSMPSNLYSVTEDTHEKDPSLVSKGANIELLKNEVMLREDEILAFSSSGEESMELMKEKSMYGNSYDGVNMKDMERFEYEFIDRLRSINNFVVVDYCLIGPYTISGDKSVYWIKVEVENKVANTDQIIYYTIVDGVAYSFSIANNNITANEETRYDEIVKSLKFVEYR